LLVTAIDIDKCRNYIEECDVFVLVLANHYGSRPTNERRSFTELEFEHAKVTDKTIFAFLIDPAYQVPVGRRDRDPEDVAALERFRAEIRKFGGVTLFGDLADLERRVTSLLGGRRAKREGRGWPWSPGWSLVVPTATLPSCTRPASSS
jgi:hypothetical protein